VLLKLSQHHEGARCLLGQSGNQPMSWCQTARGGVCLGPGGDV